MREWVITSCIILIINTLHNLAMLACGVTAQPTPRWATAVDTVSQLTLLGWAATFLFR